jgi:hypothetical protein
MKMSFCHALAKEMKIQICTTYLAIQEKNTAVSVFISLVDGVDLYLKSFIFLNADVIAGGRLIVSLQTTATILLTIESTI